MRYSITDRRYDALLVGLVKMGNRRAAERLAARWYPRLLQTARRLLRDQDQAHEAVQESWLGICRGLRSLREPEHFPAWAYGILHRKCADRIRLAQKYRRADATDGIPPPPADDRDIDQQLVLDAAISSLPDPLRAVVLLYFVEGLTLLEIAYALKIPVGTVKSRLFTARASIKSIIQGDDE